MQQSLHSIMRLGDKNWQLNVWLHNPKHQYCLKTKYGVSDTNVVLIRIHINTAESALHVSMNMLSYIPFSIIFYIILLLFWILFGITDIVFCTLFCTRYFMLLFIKLFIIFFTMQLNAFEGDLTDVSAETKKLVSSWFVPFWSEGFFPVDTAKNLSDAQNFCIRKSTRN